MNLSRNDQICFTIALFLFWAVLVALIGQVYGQATPTPTTTTGTTSTTTATPLPPTTPTIAVNPTGGTPTVATQNEIATTNDLSQQFNQTMAALIATGGTVSAGVGTVWAKMRGKAKKIDSALRGQDFDNRDLLEVLNSFFEAAKKDKTKTPGILLDDMAYKDKILLSKTIGEAWAGEYDEYMEWFTQRYTVNPE